MIRVKNLRPCVLIIPDVRLRLAPGETAELDEPSPQSTVRFDHGDPAWTYRTPPLPVHSDQVGYAETAPEGPRTVGHWAADSVNEASRAISAAVAVRTERRERIMPRPYGQGGP